LAPDDVWYVKIKDVHEEFQLIKQQIQLEIGIRLSWLTYGNYLSFLNCFEQGEAYFKHLLEKCPLVPIDRPSIYNNMALMYTMNNQKESANHFYNLALDCVKLISFDTAINEHEGLSNMVIPTANMIIPKALIDHSTVLRNIGDVYHKSNNRTKALEYYKKAFKSTTDQHCTRYYQQKIKTLWKT
jgi:tetratricopeptide (TPR) repeat protein